MDRMGDKEEVWNVNSEHETVRSECEMWEPPTVIQTSRLLASIAVIQTAKLLAPITVERTSILLGQQTPRSERRQFLYTAVRHSVA
jgi:hypothetical protein